SRKSRRGDAVLDGGGNRDAPIFLGVFDDVSEIGIEQQIVEIFIALVSIDNAVEKFRANDATATPDGGDVAKVQVPIVLFARGAEELHALRVRNNFGCVERVPDRVDKFVFVAGKLSWFWLRQNFGGGDAVVFSGRDDARF